MLEYYYCTSHFAFPGSDCGASLEAGVLESKGRIREPERQGDIWPINLKSFVPLLDPVQ